MNNDIENTGGYRFGGGDPDNYSHESRESSADQVAVVWNDNNEALTALPVPSNSSRGSFDTDLSRLPADTNLIKALKLRRANHPDLDTFSVHTHYLGISNDYSERTRILALDGEVLAYNDLELFDWLINAERNMYLGTDNHPVFEMPLEETACSFTRLPNGQIALTEASRLSVDKTRSQMRSLFGIDSISPTNLTVETPLRSAARYFLTAQPEGTATTRAGKDHEVTAFVLISRAGFSYGLWSPSTGLFTEYAFQSPSEIDPRTSAKVKRRQRGEELKGVANWKGADETESYIKNAFDQLVLQLAPEKLELLELSAFSQVVWAAESELADSVKSIAGDYSEKTGLAFVEINVPLDEAVSAGLLFGSFNFGDDQVVGASILPPVNLARDLLVLADKEEVERRRVEEAVMRKRRSQAVFTLLAAPILALAVLIGYTAESFIEQTIFSVRNYQAEDRALTLKPGLDRRRTYEANLQLYQEFIKQVSMLRRQQPVGIGMLYELNKSYPFDLDSSFYTSNLKLTDEGGIEITGLARNKDAVTSFIRSLEFAGGKESGTRMFSNLTYEVQEGIAESAPASGGQVPGISGSTFGGTLPAPGIIAWTIRGNYLPMKDLIPLPTPVPGAPGAAPPNAAPPVAATTPAAQPPVAAVNPPAGQ